MMLHLFSGSLQPRGPRLCLGHYGSKLSCGLEYVHGGCLAFGMGSRPEGIPLRRLEIFALKGPQVKKVFFRVT